MLTSEIIGVKLKIVESIHFAIMLTKAVFNLEIKKNSYTTKELVSIHHTLAELLEKLNKR